MGAGGSISINELENELNKPLDCSDIITPRGETAKQEIIHLRTLLHQYVKQQQQLQQLQQQQGEKQKEEEQKEENVEVSKSIKELEVKSLKHDGYIDINEIDSPIRHKDPHKILGVDDEEMKRTLAMRKLGISDQAFHEASDIIHHSGVARGGVLSPEDKKHSKAEHITGYTEQQQNREKAVRRVLGTSESTIEAERAEELGRVGTSTGQ